MLKISEFFEVSKEKFRKIPILKEFEWFEWFEWFGPSPTEPFNSGIHGAFGRRVCRRRECRESRASGAWQPIWQPDSGKLGKIGVRGQTTNHGTTGVRACARAAAAGPWRRR